MRSTAGSSYARTVLTLLLATSFIAGCGAQRLGGEHSDMRQALLKLYEEQVLDNLVRLRNYRSIVQLDYSNATGTLTEVAAAEASGGATSTENSFTQKPNAGGTNPATTFPLSKVIGGSFAAKASSSQSLQLTLTAQPVITTPEVYDAYLQFLASSPHCLVEVGAKQKAPEPETILVAQRFEDRFYYVPKSCGAEFEELFLRTTVQRGSYQRRSGFEMTVLSCSDPRKVATHGYVIPVKLSGSVPNDSGELTLVVAGREKKLRYQKNPDIDKGKPTNTLELLYDDSETPLLTPAEFIREIQDKKVQVAQNDYCPGNTTSTDLLKDIQSQLELLRLQDLR